MFHCNELHSKCGPWTKHDFGPNFWRLGLSGHPWSVAHFRIQTQSVFPDASLFNAGGHTVHLWTDGSVQWADIFWLNTASFAIVSQQGLVCRSGRVRALSISSFSAELWVVLEAFAIAAAPCTSTQIVKQLLMPLLQYSACVLM